MLLEESTLSFKGKPLFQRAKFQTPFEAMGKMEDMACFFYMVDGAYEVYDAGGAVKMGPKEALLKKCGSYVAHLEEGKWDGIAIFFYPEVLHEIYKYQLPSFLSDPVEVVPGKVVGGELLDKFVQGLFIYFENPELMDEELALLKMKELILILLKTYQQQDARQFIASLFRPDRIRFTEAVERNICSNITIEQMAFICHKSLSSFKREFKKVYQQSPAKYIKEKRLERAAQLLQSSTDSIAHIAYDVGFQDVTTFSASFRERFQIPPSKYRLDQNRK